MAVKMGVLKWESIKKIAAVDVWNFSMFRWGTVKVDQFGCLAPGGRRLPFVDLLLT